MKLTIMLLAGAIVGLSACDEGAIAPEQDAAALLQESAGTKADQARHRRGRMERLKEAVEATGDQQAVALLENLRAARDAARQALEAGDRETARAQMEGARAAMESLRSTVFPNANERFRHRDESHDPELRFRRGNRSERLRARIAESGNTDALALLEQADAAREALQPLRESGDRDAVREHAQAYAESMRAAMVAAFPDAAELFEHARERRGRANWRERN